MKKLFLPLLIFSVSSFAADGIHAQLSSIESQFPPSNTPTKINLNRTDSINGMEHRDTSGQVTALQDGYYFVVAAPQMIATGGCIDIWFRVNDQDVPDSNVRYCLDVESKDVIVNQNIVPLRVGDTISVYMSVNQQNLGIEAIAPENEPVIPSIIFTMFKI